MTAFAVACVLVLAGMHVFSMSDVPRDVQADRVILVVSGYVCRAGVGVNNASVQVLSYDSSDNPHWKNTSTGNDGSENPGYYQVSFNMGVIEETHLGAPLQVFAQHDGWAGSNNTTVQTPPSQQVNVTMQPLDGPQISDHTPATASTGDSFTFNATITANDTVSTAWVTYWYGNGTATNATMQQTGGYWTHTISVAHTADPLYYVIAANDSQGNWNYTAIMAVTVIDNDSPVIGEVDCTSMYDNNATMVNVTGEITDNVALNMVKIYVVTPVQFENLSMTRLAGTDTWYFNKTYSEPGTYTYYLWANDTAGNGNRSATYSVNVTAFPPSANFTYTPLSPTIEDAIQFNDTSNDTDGSIVNWTWDFDDGATSYLQSPSHQYQQAGTYNVTLTVVDNAGARGSHTEQVTVTDSIPPTTTIQVSGTEGDNDWYTGAVTITLEATDEGSAVNTTWVRINDGQWQQYTGQFTLEQEGNSTVRFYSTDIAGNQEPVNIRDISVDTTPPTTNVSRQPADPDHGEWYTSDVTVTLDAQGGFSGVNATYYRLDTGDWQVYSEAFDIDTDGVHTLSYYSIDGAGNQETEENMTLRRDGTPPETEHSLAPSSPQGNNGWYTSAVTVTLEATDATSGVNHTRYRINGGAWKTYREPFAIDTDGEHTVTYRSTDLAGNQENTSTISLKIDTEAPAVSLERPRAGRLYLFDRELIPFCTTLVIGKITIEATVNDTTSGTAYVHFSIDDTAAHNDTTAPYTWMYDNTSLCRRHAITALAADRAGNTATATVSDVRILNL